jgi:CheY-like chemotaxis protein
MNFWPSSRLPPLRGLHVLLVEDDARFARVLATVLEYCGAVVTVAASAEAALRLTATIVPHVLVVATSASLRVASRLSAGRLLGRGGVAALAIVPERDAGARDALLALGLHECLTKPLELGEFCRVVGRVAGLPAARP